MQKKRIWDDVEVVEARSKRRLPFVGRVVLDGFRYDSISASQTHSKRMLPFQQRFIFGEAVLHLVLHLKTPLILLAVRRRNESGYEMKVI